MVQGKAGWNSQPGPVDRVQGDGADVATTGRVGISVTRLVTVGLRVLLPGGLPAVAVVAAGGPG